MGVAVEAAVRREGRRLDQMQSLQLDTAFHNSPSSQQGAISLESQRVNLLVVTLLKQQLPPLSNIPKPPTRVKTRRRHMSSTRMKRNPAHTRRMSFQFGDRSVLCQRPQEKRAVCGSRGQVDGTWRMSYGGFGVPGEARDPFAVAAEGEQVF